MGGNSEFRSYFSEDETGVYVLTGPLPKLTLKQEPEPQDAPVYLDLETGKGYYPEGMSAQQAYDAADYAREKLSKDMPIHLKQDMESWRREFSELFDTNKDELGPTWSINLDERDPNE